MNTKLTCEKVKWNGREAYTLRNDLVQMVTLPGGGHIAEFQFLPDVGMPVLNPLWVPPWKTIEPHQYREKKHRSVYGTLHEGKLISGISGHNICLDNFGPPSNEEAAQGLSTHGEAPSGRWTKTRLHSTAQEVGLTLSVRLPVAGLRFSREIRMRRGETIAYITETVVNEKKADHPFHWTQHVTLGPPFLDEASVRISLPGTRGKTGAGAYGELDFLAPSRNFHWPFAPGLSGSSIDLSRPLSQPGCGTLATVLLNPRRTVQYVAALNQAHRLLIGYCFRHADFPWVAIWEENNARTVAPWKGRVQTRGLEFGSTPFPLTRRDSFAVAPMFDTPTSTFVPAKGKRTIHYVAFLAHVPESFGYVRDVSVTQNEIQIQGAGRRSTLRLPGSELGRMGLN